MSVNRKIAELREAAGMKQETLAARAKINKSQLSKIETGKISKPHIGTLRKIANALKISLDDLLADTTLVIAPENFDLPEGAKPAPNFHLNQEEIVLVTNVRLVAVPGFVRKLATFIAWNPDYFVKAVKSFDKLDIPVGLSTQPVSAPKVPRSGSSGDE